MHFTKLNKLQHKTFNIPFHPCTLSDVCANCSVNNVVDCIAIIEEEPEVIEGANQIWASVTITDPTGSIEVLVWGQWMVTCLLATAILPQRVFAFQRLKYKMFQEKPQLYLNEGAEFLVHSAIKCFKTCINLTIQIKTTKTITTRIMTTQRNTTITKHDYIKKNKNYIESIAPVNLSLHLKL